MSWARLPPEIRQIAETVLTPKQLQAWRLELEGHSTRHIAWMTNTGRTTVVDRLTRTHQLLILAGVRQSPNGKYYLEDKETA